MQALAVQWIRITRNNKDRLMAQRYAIAIPARYGSTRFPGKPLAMIAGKSMVQRVLDIAHEAAAAYDDAIDIFVATDDKRIADHVMNDLGAKCINTPPSCKTGSDRVLSALRQLDQWPDFVINLQGDAPLVPPFVVRQIFDSFRDNPKAEVVTPVHRLSWDELDALRAAKTVTPFSGTTATINAQGQALWFSKNILPAIRKEEDLRAATSVSPVYQHVGLYGFRCDILEKFCALPEGEYEALEGLEQLRMLENGIRISTVNIEGANTRIQSGIDSPEDIERAEKHIAQYGELVS